mmetsp:Transcript_62355/g.197511  ORF Transcript_62355/g.197511 Transcript_62355/m.197511 type:complete len:258 (+) Transcript_62355:1017-1790(+)
MHRKQRGRHGRGRGQGSGPASAGRPRRPRLRCGRGGAAQKAGRSPPAAEAEQPGVDQRSKGPQGPSRVERSGQAKVRRAHRGAGGSEVPRPPHAHGPRSHRYQEPRGAAQGGRVCHDISDAFQHAERGDPRAHHPCGVREDLWAPAVYRADLRLPAGVRGADAGGRGGERGGSGRAHAYGEARAPREDLSNHPQRDHEPSGPAGAIRATDAQGRQCHRGLSRGGGAACRSPTRANLRAAAEGPRHPAGLRAHHTRRR